MTEAACNHSSEVVVYVRAIVGGYFFFVISVRDILLLVMRTVMWQ